MYECDYEGERLKIQNFLCDNKKTVVVQGLGFVGSAMIAALSNAKNMNKI